MTVRQLVLAHGNIPTVGGQDFTLTETASALYVYFRSSSTAQDWIRDFLCWTVKAFGTRVHYGCWKEYQDALENKALMAPITAAKWIDKPIKLFGYSKGAAIAVLMFHYLARTRCNVTAVVAGCPPIFFLHKPAYVKTTMAMYRARIHFVRYGSDIVCWLPPWFVRNQVDYIAHSTNRGIFKCIKDHGSYVNCEEQLPSAWFE